MFENFLEPTFTLNVCFFGNWLRWFANQAKYYSALVEDLQKFFCIWHQSTQARQQSVCQGFASTVYGHISTTTPPPPPPPQQQQWSNWTSASILYRFRLPAWLWKVHGSEQPDQKTAFASPCLDNQKRLCSACCTICQQSSSQNGSDQDSDQSRNMSVQSLTPG